MKEKKRILMKILMLIISLFCFQKFASYLIQKKTDFCAPLVKIKLSKERKKIKVTVLLRLLHLTTIFYTPELLFNTERELF